MSEIPTGSEMPDPQLDKLGAELNSANVCRGGPLDLSYRYGPKPKENVLPPLCVEPTLKEPTLAYKLADPEIEANLVSGGLTLTSFFPGPLGRIARLGRIAFRWLVPARSTEPIVPPLGKNEINPDLPEVSTSSGGSKIATTSETTINILQRVSQEPVKYDPVEVERLMADPERLARLSPTERRVLELRQSTNESDKPMTLEQIARELEISTRSAGASVAKIQTSAIRKLREPVTGEEPPSGEISEHVPLQEFRDDRVLPDTLIDRSTPEEIAFRNTLSGKINKSLLLLTAREERVIRMRFGIGVREHTLEEIGDQFHVGPDRIRQIEAGALRKLMHPSRGKELKSFLPE